MASLIIGLMKFLADDFRQAASDFYYRVTDQPTPRVLRDRAILQQVLKDQEAARIRCETEARWHEDHFGAEQGWDWYRPSTNYYRDGVRRFEDQLSPWFRKNGVMLVPLGQEPPKSINLKEIFQALKPIERLVSPELMDQFTSELMRLAMYQPKQKPLIRADVAQQEWRQWRDIPGSNVRYKLRAHTIVQAADDPRYQISPELEYIVGKPVQIASYPPELPKPYWR
jgi:hypothetical protein